MIESGRLTNEREENAVFRRRKEGKKRKDEMENGGGKNDETLPCCAMAHIIPP